jgi:hypothetical protein
MTHRFELDAELALRSIREAVGTDAHGFGGDRDQLAFRSGQLFVVLILARRGFISLDALELAGVDRMVTPAEIMRHILRPLIARGFARVRRGEVVATRGMVRHRNPVEAFAAGESIADDEPVKVLRAEQVKVGDYLLELRSEVTLTTARRDDVEVCYRTDDGHTASTHLYRPQVVARG